MVGSAWLSMLRLLFRNTMVAFVGKKLVEKDCAGDSRIKLLTRKEINPALNFIM